MVALSPFDFLLLVGPTLSDIKWLRYCIGKGMNYGTKIHSAGCGWAAFFLAWLVFELEHLSLRKGFNYLILPLGLVTLPFLTDCGLAQLCGCGRLNLVKTTTTHSRDLLRGFCGRKWCHSLHLSLVRNFY